MAIVNESALFSKIKSFSETPRGKELMRQAILTKKKNGNGLTGTGDEVLTEVKMKSLADELISYLKITAASYDLAPSVMAHFNSLTYWIQSLGDGSYVFSIFFADDLSRESLEADEYTGDGIRNIVALFNNGYYASSPVYGWWNGHSPSGEAINRSLPGDNYAFIKSRQTRPGLAFMQKAIGDFYSKYAGKYPITIILDDIYGDSLLII